MMSLDVLRPIVSRLCLWDARSLQSASPDALQVVNELVAGIVSGTLARPRPQFIDTFLASPPGFQEVVHKEFTLLKTPRDRTLTFSSGGISVVLYVGPAVARLELRVVDPMLRPGFDTLALGLQALWWFASAAAASSQSVSDLDVRTRAEVHRPVSEVLNTLATTFVERHVAPLLSSASPGPSTLCTP